MCILNILVLVMLEFFALLESLGVVVEICNHQIRN